MNAGVNKSDKRNHFYRHLQYAKEVISGYDGREPFHIYLKRYFSRNKKHGSGDRKFIAAFCYGFFRLGKGVKAHISSEEKLWLGMFLSDEAFLTSLNFPNPQWNLHVSSPILQRLELVKDKLSVNHLFPFTDELSEDIDSYKFTLSFFSKPLWFIRIRPGMHEQVMVKLNAAGIPFKRLGKDCLSFEQAHNLTSFLQVGKEVIIQDYNSQRTGDLLAKYVLPVKNKIFLWDCCAASGGKSILAWDILNHPSLIVSDKRTSILKNLIKRFKSAGITEYQSFGSDLSFTPPRPLLDTPADILLADVPCTGSGTWGRTPEQLLFASKNMIEDYALLQRKIVLNALPELKSEGLFLYITCSVFKQENEENVSYFKENAGLELLEIQYFKGYEMKADTLFAALFRKK